MKKLCLLLFLCVLFVALPGLRCALAEGWYSWMQKDKTAPMMQPPPEDPGKNPPGGDMMPPGRIYGTVYRLNPDTNKLETAPGVIVDIFAGNNDGAPGDKIRSVTSSSPSCGEEDCEDEGGEYEFRSLPLGLYYLQAGKGAGWQSDYVRVCITKNKKEVETDIIMKSTQNNQNYAMIEGHVYIWDLLDPSGKKYPAKGVQVIARSEDIGGTNNVFTDDVGYYKFPQLRVKPTGSTEYTIQSPPEMATVELTPGDVKTLDFIIKIRSGNWGKGLSNK